MLKHMMTMTVTVCPAYVWNLNSGPVFSLPSTLVMTKTPVKLLTIPSVSAVLYV